MNVNLRLITSIVIGMLLMASSAAFAGEEKDTEKRAEIDAMADASM